MAIRKIVIEGDEVLTKKCRPVEKFDQRLWELLDCPRQLALKRRSAVWQHHRWELFVVYV